MGNAIKPPAPVARFLKSVEEHFLRTGRYALANEARHLRVAPPPRPEPGAVCPTCGEKKPSKAALYMREWRKKRG